jgi:LPXTG-motif cell wall-anchored protein
MNFAINNKKTYPKTGRNAAFWLNIIGAILIGGVLFLAYSLKHDGAAELQTAPWQTLLFIDHSTKNL